MSNIRAVTRSWGESCADAHIDDETGKIVIDKWHRQDIPQPSQAEIDAAAADYRAAIAAAAYRTKRKLAYVVQLGKSIKPDPADTIGDILDCLIGEVRARGASVTPEFQALCDKIDAIKAAYPKPVA